MSSIFEIVICFGKTKEVCRHFLEKVSFVGVAKLVVGPFEAVYVLEDYSDVLI